MNAVNLTALVPLCSVIFFAGYQVNRIDSLFAMVHNAEAESKDTKDIIFDIHGKVCSIEHDIKNIEKKLK